MPQCILWATPLFFFTASYHELFFFCWRVKRRMGPAGEQNKSFVLSLTQSKSFMAASLPGRQIGLDPDRLTLPQRCPQLTPKATHLSLIHCDCWLQSSVRWNGWAWHRWSGRQTQRERERERGVHRCLMIQPEVHLLLQFLIQLFVLFPNKKTIGIAKCKLLYYYPVWIHTCREEGSV